MGLFINKKIHQHIYKNKEQIKEPNQSFFQKNHLTELLKDQQKNNKLFHQSMLDIKVQNEQQAITQEEQWKVFFKQLQQYGQKSHHYEQKSSLIIDELKRLREDHNHLQHFVTREQSVGQEIKKQISFLKKANENLLKQSEDSRKNYDEIKEKIIDQNNKQEEVSAELLNQKATQQELANKFDQHEALLEKIIRQLEYIRSTIFERTSYVTDKIENGYFIISSYITQLLTGSPHIQKEFRMLNQQKEDQKNK